MTAPAYWSPDEDAALLRLVSEGRKSAEIAHLMGRSVRGVTMRLKRLMTAQEKQAGLVRGALKKRSALEVAWSR